MTDMEKGRSAWTQTDPQFRCPADALISDSTAEFLKWWFSGRTDDKIVISQFRPSTVTRFFGNEGDAARFASYLDSENPQALYFRMTTVPAGFDGPGRGDAKDSAHLYGIMLDCDVKGDGHKATNYPDTWEGWEKVLDAAGFPEPSAVIASGGGFYPCWKLTERVDITDVGLHRAQRLAEEWHGHAARHAEQVGGWKLDAAKDLARVFGLPGTHNRKNPRAPKLRTVIHMSGRSYTLAELESYLPGTGPVSSPPTPMPLPASMPASGGSSLFASQRNDTHEDNTHDRDWYAAQWTERAQLLDTAYSRGSFNNELNAFAVWVGHAVPSLYTEDGAWRILTDAVTRTFPDGPDSDDINAMRSGLKKGMSEPWAITDLKDVTAALAEPATPRPSLRDRLLTPKQLREVPRAQPLIKGVLSLNSATWLIGAPGSFKSFVALDWAAHVASGRTWNETHRVTQRPVIYVLAEGVSGFRDRVTAWEKYYCAELDELYVLPVAVRARSADGMSVSNDWRELRDIVAEIKPGLVVLDTQARLSVGWEENNNTQMSLWVNAVDMLKDAAQCCTLVVHHTGRNGADARGASALDGAQDAEWRVDRKTGELKCRIKCDKNKDGADDAKWTFAMNVVPVDVDEDGQAVTSLVLGPQAEDSQERSVVGQLQLTASEGRTLTSRAIVHRVLSEFDSEGDGMTLPEIERLVNDARKRAGQDPYKKGVVRAALNGSFRDGLVFHPSRARWALGDPLDQG